MAAPGPLQPPPELLGPRLRVAVEVMLRVPTLFFIDTIFNSSPVFSSDSFWAGFLGGLLRLLGELPLRPGLAEVGGGVAGEMVSAGMPPPSPFSPSRFPLSRVNVDTLAGPSPLFRWGRGGGESGLQKVFPPPRSLLSRAASAWLAPPSPPLCISPFPASL